MLKSITKEEDAGDDLLEEGVEGVLETGEPVVGKRVEAKKNSGVGNQITRAGNALRRIVCVHGVE